MTLEQSFSFSVGGARCETCDGPAQTIVSDGSAWCFECYLGAVRIGWDPKSGCIRSRRVVDVVDPPGRI